MDINKIRSSVITQCTRTNALSGQREPLTDGASVTALALIYLGDAIREGTSDIGPALQDGLNRLSAEVADLANASR